MKNIQNSIIDAGPLIALFNKNDNYHQQAVKFIKKYRGDLFTTWPVVTEVMHMLNANFKCQLNFLKYIDRGGIEIVNLSLPFISRLIDLFTQYSDVPINLADATLIVLSERKQINKIITIDSDFHIYRNKNTDYVKNIFKQRR